jgi:hypothetical protein
LQYFAEAGWNAYPSFTIDRMVEATAEHRVIPLCATISHFFPPTVKGRLGQKTTNMRLSDYFRLLYVPEVEF